MCWKDFTSCRNASVRGGRRFLMDWTTRAVRSLIEPIKNFARTLLAHEPQLLNYFRAHGVFAAGATEGFDNGVRITTRRSYEFRRYEQLWGGAISNHFTGRNASIPSTHSDV
jgi:hypothetical protein